MNYQENSLTYEEYCSLRESVGWKNFPKIQIQEILKNSLKKREKNLLFLR